MSLREIGPRQVMELLRLDEAADALEAVLAGGFDPEADPPRTTVRTARGELLVMPSEAAGHLATKLVTVGGQPRVQGTCVVFDPRTLAPAALVDGAALTLLRTPAVSAVAVRRLVRPDASRLLVLGRGPQADGHVHAMRAARPSLRRVDVVGRERGPGFEALVRGADLIVCATTATDPLFPGAWVRADATVVAMGAHDLSAREVDDALVARSTVVVESRTSALRESGAVVRAIGVGTLRPEALVTLADLVTGRAAPIPGRPSLYVATGMAWEDAVVAGTLLAAAGR